MKRALPWLIIGLLVLGVGLYLSTRRPGPERDSPSPDASENVSRRQPSDQRRERSPSSDRHEFAVSEPLVKGTVTARNTGRPVAGATVVFLREAACACTDHKGRYAIGGIPAGETLVLAYADGLTTPSVIRATVEADEDTQLDIVLDPAVSLTGLVLDAATGEPIPDATISIRLARYLDLRTGYGVTAGEFGGGFGGGFGRAFGGRFVMGTIPRFDGGFGGGFGGESPGTFGGFSREALLGDNYWDIACDKAFALTTDARGSFTVPHLLPEMQVMDVDAAAYLPAEVSIKGADPAVPFVVKLRRGLTVAGRTVSPTGQPVPNATVLLVSSSSWRFTPPVETDEQGRFEIGKLVEGTYTLYARHEDYSDVELSKLEVGKDLPLRDLQIRFPDPAFISGTITDERGVSVQGSVEITSIRSRGYIGPSRAHISFDVMFERGAIRAAGGHGSGRANEDGTYTIGPLAPGRYSVVVSDPSHYRPEPQTIELVEGEARSGVDFVLRKKEGRIAGKVVNADGEPVVEAQVYLDEDDDLSSVRRSYMTDEQGDFACESVAPGRITIEVDADGYPRKKVAAKAPADDIVITLDRGGTVIGRIVDKQTREPVSAFQVRDAWTGWAFSPGEGDEAGRFVLSGLPEGDHDLSVDAGGYAPVEVKNVWVEEGVTAEVLVEVVRGATVVFRVTAAADGSPVADACVEWTCVELSYTDQDGVCRLEHVSPGVHDFGISHDTLADESVRVSIGEQETTKEVHTALREAATLRGRVVAAADGSPIAGARVTLARDYQGGDWQAGSVTGELDATTDSEGAFEIPRLELAAYVLLAEKPGHAMTMMPVDTREKVNGGLVVELGVGGRIMGTVATPDGQPLADVAVLARGLGTTTDVAGRFAFANVSPGVCEVEIASGGQTDSSVRPRVCKEVTVVEAEEVNVDFVVGGGFRLYGVVTSGGRPLEGVGLVIGSDNVAVSYVTTDTQGRYSVEGLPPGSFTMSIQIPRSTAGADRGLDHRQFEMESKDTEFNVELGAGRVAGVVRSGDGAAIRGARVDLQRVTRPREGADAYFETASDDDFDATCWSDVRGRFAFNALGPGSYTLTAGAEGYATRSMPLDVKGEQETADLVVTLVPEAVVTARIRTSDGALPVSVYFAACDEESRVPVRGQADVDTETGQCRLTGFGAGEHDIFIAAAGYAPVVEHVTISPASGATLDLGLEPGRELEVKLIGPAGTSLEGAEVVLDPGGNPALARLLNEAQWLHGNYIGDDPSLVSLHHLPEGTYTVRVRCDGCQDASVPVTIAGSDQEVTVTLRQGSTQ